MELSQEIHVVVSDLRLCIALKDSSSEVGESLHLNLSLSLPWLWLGGAAFSEKMKKWSEVTQLCPTLCNPRDFSLPGSSVHGIFQAKILEWVAISFSRGSSQPRDRTQVSHTAGRLFTVWATREALRKPWFIFMAHVYTICIYWGPHTIQPLGCLPETKAKRFEGTSPYCTRSDSQRKKCSWGRLCAINLHNTRNHLQWVRTQTTNRRNRPQRTTR